MADLDFRVHRDRIERLSNEATGRNVYLCGGAGHEFHFWQLLDAVIYLSVDSNTLRRRLAERTDNAYGKAPDELDSILRANETWEAMYRDHGALVVDASRPLDEVADQVIELAERPLH